MPALRKEVLNRRAPRAWLGLAVAIALPAQLATMHCLREPRTEIRVQVVERHTADVIAVPIPLPVENVVRVPAERAACPPPRSDAPSGQPGAPPEPVTRVRPSVTNAGWVAAWNDQHIYLSTDAGVTWQRQLDGEDDVDDVTFDCFGRAIAMRGNRIGVRDGAKERWRTLGDLHGDAATAVLGGGPDLVVFGVGPGDDTGVRLLVSHDLGATWRQRTLATYWEGGVRGRQLEDGQILANLPVIDCMTERAFAFRYRDGEVEAHAEELLADAAVFGDRFVASNGWQRIGGAVHDVPTVTGEYTTIIEGPYPILVGGDGAWRLDGARLKRLPWKLGGEEQGLVADRAGRIWSVLCGRPHVAARALPAACQGAGDSR